MNTVLFAVLCVLLHRVLFRLVRRDDKISLLEQNSAALTFQFCFWIALSFLLGFLGLFRLFYLVNLGAVFLALIYFLTICTREHDAEKSRAGANFWASLAGLSAYSRVMFTIAIFTALFFLANGIRKPIMAWDELSYHLGLSIHMYQDGDFRNYPGESFMTNHFARGLHLLMSITIMLSGTIRYVNTVQWLIVPILLPSVYTATRAMGASRAMGITASALVMTIPVLAYQTTLAYADLFSTSFFAVGLCVVAGTLRYGSVGPVRILWMFASAGLALAAKFNAAPVCVILGVVALITWGPSRMFELKRAHFGVTVAGFLIAASVGLPWMVRNWVQFGSPIYPLMLTNSTERLAEGEYPLNQARVISEPGPYYDMPLSEKTWLSWTKFDFESWNKLGLLGWKIPRKELVSNGELFNPFYGYWGDDKYGGNGLLWFFISLPSMIGLLIYGVYTIIRKKQTSLGIMMVCLSIAPLLGYVATMSAWWPRFSIFLPIMGVVCFVILTDVLLKKIPLAGKVILVLGLAIASFDWTTIVFLNRDWERSSRYENETGGSLTPIHLWTWVNPQSPRYAIFRKLVDSASPGETISFWCPGGDPDPNYGVPFTGEFANEKANVRQFLFPSMWPSPNRYSPADMIDMMRVEKVRLFLVSDYGLQKMEPWLQRYDARQLYRVPGFSIFEFPKEFYAPTKLLASEPQKKALDQQNEQR